jgi:hypothetical protein
MISPLSFLPPLILKMLIGSTGEVYFRVKIVKQLKKNREQVKSRQHTGNDRSKEIYWCHPMV